MFENTDLGCLLWLLPRAGGSVLLVRLGQRVSRSWTKECFQRGADEAQFAVARRRRAVCIVASGLAAVAWFVLCPIPPRFPLFI